MKLRTIFSLSLFLALLFFGLTLQAQARPAAQLPQFATPTPGPDGRILYTVQPGQTCIQISLLTGISVDTLRTLNQLDENCTLSEGQTLILGIGGPVSQPTLSGPTPTVTPSLPTPTPPPGNATLCIVLYDDLNGDALRQEEEPLIAEGAASVSGASGQFSQALPTQGGADPTCFQNLPQGPYTISAAAPQGYYPTSAQSLSLDIKAGEKVYVDFGAQRSGEQTAAQPGEAPKGAGALVGLTGAALLLGALGLGFYAWRSSTRKPPLQNTPKPPSILR